MSIELRTFINTLLVYMQKKSWRKLKMQA